LPVPVVDPCVNYAFAIVVEELVVLMRPHKFVHKSLERPIVVGEDEVGPNHVVGMFEEACAAGYWSGALHDSGVELQIELVLCFTCKQHDFRLKTHCQSFEACIKGACKSKVIKTDYFYKDFVSETVPHLDVERERIHQMM
jgi:hypothetical protein